ncbi:MAG TPA: molybdate ABC transporter substrate-binding protein [Methylibium sp.]|uniref:molybdate ABC transporter substrate-binding protein n=1 Tax=Methylibium sp. TaxID=2067992 RepID=UPI002DBFE1AF|nr:molybdate ABC transporter substrate-binding protein [Methylibium sp.]HEU4458520.1 molybdate ABC transporter substrate-binding protein [Methylibium sp.]
MPSSSVFVRRGLVIGACVGLLTSLAPRAACAQDEAVVVFAAASLADVLRQIARDGGFTQIRFSFAASSTLARQIEQGANAQVFVSADEPWMDAVEKTGRVAPGQRRELAANRLALIGPGSAEAAAPQETAAAVESPIRKLLATPDARIATGDPAHVPVGRYAQAALASLALWPAVEPRLARADNVRSALVLVERGEAPLGITYRTDALASKNVRVLALFPLAAHPPIRYPAALLNGASPDAQRFFQHLFAPAAQAALRQAGFGPPPGP